MAARYSSYSNGSSLGPLRPGQVSTTTLLNALHTFYTSGRAYQVDASTSLVVNTCITTTVDRDLAARAWEHARRRAEDGCIVLW